MNEKVTKDYLAKYVRLLLMGAGLALFLLLGASLTRPITPAYAELPPRPTEVPGDNTSDPDSLNGAQIKLVVAEAKGNEWTAVQWQDASTGEWHTVEGWQGTLEADGTQVWWVGSEQFGRGPLRWQLFAEKEGALLEVSESFTMPTRNKEIVTVTIPSVED